MFNFLKHVKLQFMVEAAVGKILIIDQDLVFIKQAKAYLEDNDFSVAISTVDDGLSYLSENLVNVVLLDNNRELISTIIKEYPHIPVIVISDSDQINDVIDALRLGAWNFFQRPVTNLPILEHAICKALEKNRLEIENEAYAIRLKEINQKLTESLALLEADQIAGRNVQLQLLPADHYQFEDVRLNYKIMPSLYLSGDFIDYFKISDHKIGFYIADVSGHGASSAFVTVLLKSQFEKLILDYKNGINNIILQPEQLLKIMSDYFFSLKLGKYLTMNYFVLDTNMNNLQYSIGGHYPSPILYDGHSAKFLEGSGFAVGIFDRANFNKYEIVLPRSYQLTLFSDGIIEIMSGENLKENEAILLSALSKVYFSSDELSNEFKMNSFEFLPDDIAFFMLTKNLN